MNCSGLLISIMFRVYFHIKYSQISSCIEKLFNARYIYNWLLWSRRTDQYMLGLLRTSISEFMNSNLRTKEIVNWIHEGEVQYIWEIQGFADCRIRDSLNPWLFTTLQDSLIVVKHFFLRGAQPITEQTFIT